MKLYDYELSGNCYKVRLFMSLLSIGFESYPVEFYPAAEHKSPWFRLLNPLAQLPVLEDEGMVLPDSNAILVYLASKFDEAHLWFPVTDAPMLGQVVRWFGIAEAMNNSLYAARLHESIAFPLDLKAAQERGRSLLQMTNDHLELGELTQSLWLCGRHPTVADIACFPYIVLAEEGGVSLRAFSGVKRWLERIKRLPGFVAMPGVLPTSSAIEAA